MTGFSTDVRDALRPGVQASAVALVPVLAEYVPDLSHVIDVGCGEGWWMREFAAYFPAVVEKGIALGVDHPTSVPDVHRTPDGTAFVGLDLDQPLHEQATFGPFDLALCLETAEHLQPARADSLIRDLCVLAPVVAFSAAVPYQGGVNHVNEQWPGYWAARFHTCGYHVSGALRWRIWNDDRIEPWYRQNLLIAWDPQSGPEHSGLVGVALGDEDPIGVVHPAIWEAYRGTVSS